jgi:hypothetical protein
MEGQKGNQYINPIISPKPCIRNVNPGPTCVNEPQSGGLPQKISAIRPITFTLVACSGVTDHGTKAALLSIELI